MGGVQFIVRDANKVEIVRPSESRELGRTGAATLRTPTGSEPRAS
jgi:hypothetical protein